MRLAELDRLRVRPQLCRRCIRAVELHRRNYAAVHHGVVEGKCRSVIASLGLGSIFLAFAHRLGLFPTQIAGSRNKLLDIIAPE